MLTKINNTIYTIEKLFLILAVFSLCLLFAFQLLHIWDGNTSSNIYKSLLIHEDYETKPIFSAGKITLSVLGNEIADSSLSIHVNGEIYGNFEQNQVDIIVRNHDIISIEGADDSLDSLQFKVINATENILFPKINSGFILDRSGEHLFTVEFR